jgi:hypothetical protein
MKHQKTLLAMAMLASAAVTGTAQASLVDRGNGLLYDDVLDVTWLQDANYAKTSGASVSGLMDWNTATTWAADLVYGGYSDWRLASNTPVSGDSGFNYGYSVTGSTDSGYNITSPHSELAYMYYVNLGLKSSIDMAGNSQFNFGIFGDGTLYGQNDLGTYYFGQNSDGTYYQQNNVGLVNNLQNSAYWSGAEFSPGSVNSWEFTTQIGYQNNSIKSEQLYAWAVRPGDVAAVPVPGAVWLFGSGLLGLLGMKKRRNLTV